MWIYSRLPVSETFRATFSVSNWSSKCTLNSSLSSNLSLHHHPALVGISVESFLEFHFVIYYFSKIFCYPWTCHFFLSKSSGIKRQESESHVLQRLESKTLEYTDELLVILLQTKSLYSSDNFHTEVHVWCAQGRKHFRVGTFETNLSISDSLLDKLRTTSTRVNLDVSQSHSNWISNCFDVSVLTMCDDIY